MTTARFKVSFAGPLVSFQDAGRIGHLRFGVSASGPMDRFAHRAANAMIGNAISDTTIEVSLGGLILECVEGETAVALAGGKFNVITKAGQSEGWGVHALHPGDKITVRAGEWGSWCYLAFGGQIDVDPWLGATSTHSMTGFGAGTLTAGTEFAVHSVTARDSRLGDYPIPKIAEPTGRIRAVIGPQDQHFTDAMIKTFFASPYRVTDAFDRMGARLDGPMLQLNDALSIPSEPIIRGSVQISGDGVPTILLADHQTTGGYPKIATVLSCDVDQFSQMRSGDTVHFAQTSATDAINALRDHHAVTDALLQDIAAPRASLAEKLSSLNLIDGVVAD